MKTPVKEAVDRFIARVRHNMDVHLETLAADLVHVVEDEPGGSVNVERLLADLARPARPDRLDGRLKLDVLAKLVGSIRLLDEAMSLKGILDALGRGAAAEASRTSVLLVDGETLRSFNDFGFTTGPRPADVPIDSFGVLQRAVSDRQRTTLSPGAANSSDVPAFLCPTAGHVGLVIPVVVGGKVVALVCAEGPDRHGDPAANSAWTESVEVLVRHASSRLENVTSRRTVEVLTKA